MGPPLFEWSGAESPGKLVIDDNAGGGPSLLERSRELGGVRAGAREPGLIRTTGPSAGTR